MKKFLFTIVTAFMMMFSMSSCETLAVAAVTDTVAEEVVISTAYNFYWAFDHGYYYRRPCPVYYSNRPFYWGGPRNYYHRNWHPSYKAPRRYEAPRQKPHNYNRMYRDGHRSQRPINRQNHYRGRR